MAVTQALKADDAAAAAAAAQARRDANSSGSEPAQGVEEIWNQKQLAKVVGTMVASSVSIGQTRPLAAIESSVRIGDGMRAKFLDPCGGLGGWLQQHHGADFVVADGAVGLTDEGKAKHGIKALVSAGDAGGAGLAAAEPVPEEAKAVRSAVFAELAAIGAKRLEEGS